MENIRFRTIVRNEDDVVRDHRVHDTRIMPGVTFFDMIYKFFESRGEHIRYLQMSDVLFKEPIVTSEEFDKEVEFQVSEENDIGQITAKSRKVKDGQPLDENWSDNFQCNFAHAAAMEDEYIRIEDVEKQAVKTEDMDFAYGWARRVQINHYTFMKALGKIIYTETDIFALLHLSELAKTYTPFSVLHPAFLDASTVIPIILHLQREYDTKDSHDKLQPYIPMYIKSFQTNGKLTEQCLIRIKNYKTLLDSQSHDIAKSDIYIYDSRGKILAKFTELTYKKVREQQLITNLSDGRNGFKDGIYRFGQVASEKKISKNESSNEKSMESVEQMVKCRLKKMISEILGCGEDEVSTSVGYYEQGLDSTSLLYIVSLLEEMLHTKLYPTLLFEYSNIDELCKYLAEEYQDICEEQSAGSGNMEIKEQNQDSEVCLLKPTWETKPLLPDIHSGVGQDTEFIVFDTDDRLYEKIQSAYVKNQVHLVQPAEQYHKIDSSHFEIRVGHEGDYVRLIGEINSDGKTLCILHHLAPSDGLPAMDEDAKDRSIFSVFYISKALMNAGVKSKIKMFCIYDSRMNKEDGQFASNPIFGGLSGFFKTIGLENPRYQYRLIGLEHEMDIGRIVESELSSNMHHVDVRYVNEQRQVKIMSALHISEQAKPNLISNHGVYLITGGLGGLGLLFTQYFAEKSNAVFVLSGRSRLSDEKKEWLLKLSHIHFQIDYIQADVSKAEEVSQLHEQIISRYGKLDGIFHMAGVNRDAYIMQKETQDILDICKTKVDATVLLDKLTAKHHLEFFIMFSSTSSVTGNAGQSDYAFGNGFMNEFAAYRNGLVKRGLRHGRTLSICWPLWESGGMQVDAYKKQSLLDTLGMVPLSTDKGTKALEAAYMSQESEVIVVEGNKEKIYEAFGVVATKETEFAGKTSSQLIHTNSGEKQKDHKDIAIIGISGTYPQAEDLILFWENMVEKRDCITEIPENRWCNQDYYDEKAGKEGKSYAKWGGFIENPDCFDYKLFNIPPSSAEMMDPQERLFLQEVYHAFEDAGYSRKKISGIKTGVFVGAMWGQYDMRDMSRAGASVHADIANHVSFYFNLTGPSMAVDTMCSSSVTAVHLACQSLLNGECGVAVAGGVNIATHPNKNIYLSQKFFFSTDGRCKAFGDGGDGYVPGEGVGAVILKPLAQAVSDGDHIYGVVKGSSINHGGRASGYTVPNPAAQSEVITEAIKAAGLDAGTITYIEAHGTGTSLGDPIEAVSLTKAFRKDTQDTQFCAIGSLKSNYGHMESAAGVASITKVLLQFKYKTLLPSIHHQTPNPNIDFEHSPFYLQSEVSPWIAQIEEKDGSIRKLPLRAGISAFGAGGSNAHMILEEYVREEQPMETESQTEYMVILSAGQKDRLKETAAKLREYLAKEMPGKGTVSQKNGLLYLDDVREVIQQYCLLEMDDSGESRISELGLDLLAFENISNEIVRRFGVYISMNEMAQFEKIIDICCYIGDNLSEINVSTRRNDNLLRLGNIAFTLATGRDYMTERVAILTDSIDDLIYKIELYCSENAHKDIFEGSSNSKSIMNSHILKNLTQDDIMDKIRQNELRALAELWVVGTDIPLEEVYYNQNVRRIPLPGYAFEKTRLWIPMKDTWSNISANEGSIHPLLDKNESYFGQIMYTKEFTGQEIYFIQHQINGKKILPGACFLEMALTAARTAIPDGTAAALQNVRWHKPMDAGTFPLKTNVKINVGDGVYTFAICSERGEIYCTGSIAAKQEDDSEFNIQSKIKQLQQYMEKDAIYAKFDELQYRYGPQFRNIKTLYSNDKEALGKIEMSGDVMELNQCNPIGLDSAFQMAGMLLNREEDVLYVPSGIDELKINHAMGREFYAFAREVSDEDSLKYNITLTDISGKVLAEITHFRVAKMKKRIEGHGDSILSIGQNADQNVKKYLRTLFADLMKIPLEEVDDAKHFDEYGFDSIFITKMNQRMEEHFTKLSKTLFFQVSSINETAAYLMKHHEKDIHQLPNEQQSEAQESSYSGQVFENMQHDLHYLEEKWVDRQFINHERDSRGIVLFAQDNIPKELYPKNSDSGSVILVRKGYTYQKKNRMEYVVNPLQKQDYQMLLQDLNVTCESTAKIIYGWSEPNDNVEHATVKSLLLLTQSLLETGAKSKVICLLPEYEKPLEPALEAIGAFARSVNLETAENMIKTLRIEKSSSAGWEDIAAELVKQAMEDVEVKLAGNGRKVKVLFKANISKHFESSLRVRGTYLITGGMGGLGRIISQYLAKEYNANLILAGRTPIDGKKQEFLDELMKSGGHCTYIMCDISDFNQVEHIMNTVIEEYGTINGMIHCAGVIRDSLLMNKSLQQMDEVCKPKMQSTTYLYESSKRFQLDFIALFGSMAGMTGNIGQCDYAYANAFMNSYARDKGLICINWPLWRQGGMHVDEESSQYLYHTFGIVPMDTDKGIQAFEAGLSSNAHAIGVIQGIEDKLVQKNAAHPIEERNMSFKKNVQECNQPVAIIGISGRYPEAENLDDFWENIRSGKDCIREIPRERWQFEAHFNQDKSSIGTSYSKWGGFLSHIDKFDPLIFNISPKEAEFMSPEEKLFLQSAWHAFEDGGYGKQSLSGKKIGVFTGSMYNQYQLEQGLFHGKSVSPLTFPAGIANRVSYFYNLSGPSISLDTMCSTAFTAIHLACQSIGQGESEMALAGGVNLSLHPNKYNALSMNQFVSTDGKCRSFGKGGDGYVPGEGVGAVLLKPLDKAVEDGDYIYGVIRATAVNHGGKTNGFTVPNPKAQAAVIEEAMVKANISADDIGYIEAHGTGTTLGDPIEITGLSSVFEKYTTNKQFCAIGSVKSNIGHLEAASGMAGLTKVLWQMKHKTLVSSLHAEEMNPNIDFADTAFYVQKNEAPWLQRNGRRLAGLSAFGAGGANAHVIVEEYCQNQAVIDNQEEKLFVLSAKDTERLKVYAGSVQKYIKKHMEDSSVSLTNILYSFQMGRTEMEERLAIICRDKQELFDRLGMYVAGHGQPTHIFTGRAGNGSDINSSYLRDIAQQWVKGNTKDWSVLYTELPQKIPVPVYPFRQNRCWLGSFEQERAHEDVSDDKTRYNKGKSKTYDSGEEYDGNEVQMDIIDKNIAVITLQDRLNRNIFSSKLRSGIKQKLYEANHNESIKVIVITGYDNIFCMGATKDQLNDISDQTMSFTDEPVLYKGLLESKVPVISAIQGHAYGGGFLFGLYGDMVILGEESIYSAIFMKYGFTPGMGATLILEEKLGKNIATEMMFTANHYTGSELKQRGATVIVKKQNQVLDEAIQLARALCGKPRKSLMVLKEELAGRILQRLDEVIRKEDSMHLQTFSCKEVKENIHKFYVETKTIPQTEAELCIEKEGTDLEEDIFLAEHDIVMEGELYDMLSQLEKGNITVDKVLELEEV